MARAGHLAPSSPNAVVVRARPAAPFVCWAFVVAAGSAPRPSRSLHGIRAHPPYLRHPRPIPPLAPLGAKRRSPLPAFTPRPLSSGEGR